MFDCYKIANLRTFLKFRKLFCNNYDDEDNSDNNDDNNDNGDDDDDDDDNDGSVTAMI